jgi:transposase
MPTRRAPIERIDLSPARARGLLERVRPKLVDEEFRELKALVDTLVYLAELVAHTNASIARLRALLFGTESTEKTGDVLARAGVSESSPSPHTPEASPPNSARPPDATTDGSPSAGRRRGHGRYGAAAYTGALRVTMAHPSLKPGAPCPACDGGKVYVVREPTVLVRFVGQAPIGATVCALEKLRCHLCGAIFTAPPPAGVGTEKYDARTGAMIALLKYGSGVPFYRLARLQAHVGVPLPASTQWEIVASLATQLRPVHAELIRQAANGKVLYNDDTSMTVLSLLDPSPPERSAMTGPVADDEVSPTRTGIFTSGIVATTRDGHRVALFLTGRRHAGENLATVLAQRTAGLEPPILMCDALSRNVPKNFAVVLANCLCHGRRQVVDVAPNFPQESRYILEAFRDVYRVDAQARERGLTPEARLAFHQEQSRPRMAALHVWLDAQFTERRVEPNSGLGQAIRYLLRHWTPLTRFLEIAGAPLDSNLVERALKRAILHRKASLFYKTPNGAHVGDLFMAIIHTCELNRVEAFDYLTVLQQHLDALQAAPGAWLPWTYWDTIRQLSPALPAAGACEVAG